MHVGDSDSRMMVGILRSGGRIVQERGSTENTCDNCATPPSTQELDVVGDVPDSSR